MTNAATAQTNVADEAVETAQAKPLSKMDICTKIYNEVFAPGYDLKGKGQRANFIARAKDEAAMSQSGANTYYQNLSNAARGLGKYKYNKYESKKGSKASTAAPTAPAEEGSDLPGAGAINRSTLANLETQAKDTIRDLGKRWKVQNEAGEVVNSFDTRAKAKEAATEGLKVVDSQAK